MNSSNEDTLELAFSERSTLSSFPWQPATAARQRGDIIHFSKVPLIHTCSFMCAMGDCVYICMPKNAYIHRWLSGQYSKMGKKKIPSQRGNFEHHCYLCLYRQIKIKPVTINFIRGKKIIRYLYLQISMLTMVEKNYAGNLSSWVFYDINISS